MSGPAVECVQDALGTRNTQPTYTTKGVFDATTERYVRSYQDSFGYPATGYVDRQTGHAMLSDIYFNLGSTRYDECTPLVPHTPF
jgi:peptidoglycan hydrolase-like protein with peptidoglycan-binding domain